MNFKKLLILIISVLIIWIIWSNINIQTTNYTIKSKRIPDSFDGFVITVVSDLHNYNWKSKLIDKIKESNPDIIAVTGDLVDSRTPDFDISLNFIKEAVKIAPTYYVTGNHEAVLHQFPEFEKELEEEGVILLDDKSRLISVSNESINIVGVKDPLFNSYGKTHSQTIQESLDANLSDSYYNVVLSHRPEHFATYVRSNADLVLTGHAHGGQVRIPFVGGLIAPNQGFFPKYTEGVHSEKNTNMVISRGLGNSIVPVRINNMPELVIIQLQSEK